MSMAGDGHGNCECPLMLGTNVPSVDICNHLAPMPTAGRELPLLGHCANMADGHVCQLPRDLREDPNRSAFLEGRAFSPFLLLLNAEPVGKTIYQILLWFLGTPDPAHPCHHLSPFTSVGNGRCVVHTGLFQHPPHTYIHSEHIYLSAKKRGILRAAFWALSMSS